MVTKTASQGTEVEEIIDTEKETSEPAPKMGPMDELLKNAQKRPQLDEVVEGPVVAVGRARVFVDLPPYQ